MITKAEAMTARVFHYGECRAKVGPRGGVEISREEWRRSGETQTWKREPARFRVPIKFGMYRSSSITEIDAVLFHTEENCVLLITGNIDKAPEWLLEEQRAQFDKVRVTPPPRDIALGDSDACHAECGEITDRDIGMHCHQNDDGRCWHEDGDRVST